MHTAESDSAVTCTPQSLAQRWHAHHRVWISGGMHTSESDSAVTCTPQNLTQRWHAHHRVWISNGIHSAVILSGDMHTAKSDSAVTCTPPSLTQRGHSHRRVWLSGGMCIAESDSALVFTPQSLTQRWYVHRGIKTLFKTSFACRPGYKEKNIGRKIATLSPGKMVYRALLNYPTCLQFVWEYNFSQIYFYWRGVINLTGPKSPFIILL